MSDAGKSECADIGGECITARDGYYIVSAICMTLGAVLLVFYIAPVSRRLQGELFCTNSFLFSSCSSTYAALRREIGGRGLMHALSCVFFSPAGQSMRLLGIGFEGGRHAALLYPEN